MKEVLLLRKKAPIIKAGDVFDDIVVIEFLGRDKNYTPWYNCECLKCGRRKKMRRSVLIDHIGTTHFACGKGIKTLNSRFYLKWQGLRSRTENPNCEHYDCYGGRGIKSDAFAAFIDFYDTMFDSYCEAVKKYGDESVVSIDRIDVNGDYCPENCRWVHISEQKGNMRRNKPFKAVSPSGEVFYEKNQAKFAREHGLCDKQISACLTGRFKTHLKWKFSYINEV